MGPFGLELGGASTGKILHLNRGLEIRKEVRELKVYIWIHEQVDVEVKVVGITEEEHVN